jgi:hypothetical protein
MPIEFNAREVGTRALSRIRSIPGEINYTRVAVRTGLIALGISGAVYGISQMIRSADESYQKEKAAVEDIMTGRNIEELSLLDKGTFRIIVRRPWDDSTNSSSNKDFAGYDKTSVADRALGNALRTVRGVSGCEVNSVNGLGKTDPVYPQFGNFTVTTRC